MPRTLILEPTRELAAQVEEKFNEYGVNHKLNVALLIGGVSFDDQLKKLDRGARMFSSPRLGRLLDLFERGRILMTGVEILVIDEADRMLDMGFIPDIERIVGLVPVHKTDSVLLRHHATRRSSGLPKSFYKTRWRSPLRQHLRHQTRLSRSSFPRRRKTTRSAPCCGS